MTHSSPKLPSVDSLAAIAAIIANGGSHVNEPARTALDLWKECHRLIQLEERIERNNCEPDPERDEFLAACGLTQNDIELGDVVSGRPVPLEEFLKAIASKFKPKLKPETMLEKWEAFWCQEKENPARRGRDTASFFETMKLPRGSDQAIDRDSMVGLRMLFLIYLKNQSKVFADNKGTAGPRAKKVYKATRAVLGGTTVPPEIEEVLKGITAGEIQMAEIKLTLEPKDVEKLKAAIQSAKLPKEARPKRSQKAGVENS